MQPPRPPPAAVVARSAGSVRRLAPSGSARRLGLRWQRPSSRAQSAASLPHYGTRETRSRLRQSTSRMNGLFAGGFWARHALLGEIRALRRNLGRDSYVPQIAGRDPDTANVFGRELDAQEPPSVQMSPDNKFIVRISPENEAVSESRPTTPRCSNLARKTLRRARGRHAADERPARSPWRSICNPNAISCITLGATRPVKPAKPTTRRSAKKSFSLKMPPATARFRFRSDAHQIFVRYFGIFPASVSSHQ